MLERSVRIRYRPVLFAGLLKAHGLVAECNPLTT